MITCNATSYINPRWQFRVFEHNLPKHLTWFFMRIEDQNAGDVIRREVMGTTHVGASLGNATEFDIPLQEATMEHVNYLYYCP
jgi:hypothetical protein